LNHAARLITRTNLFAYRSANGVRLRGSIRSAADEHQARVTNARLLAGCLQLHQITLVRTGLNDRRLIIDDVPFVDLANAQAVIIG